MDKYEETFLKFKETASGYHVFKEPMSDAGSHPENFVDYECQFTANQIARLGPGSILDIGSYRHFLMGLMAHYQVTTIDVRPRKSELDNETNITCDAAKLDLPDDSFEAVVSLCALEHMGLGRYGDPIDFDGDVKVMKEMKRVLRPGGLLIFTTTIHNGPPAIAFNAHRIYNHEQLKAYCAGLTLVEERFYSHEKMGFCAIDRITSDPKWWDVYLGCWRK